MLIAVAEIDSELNSSEHMLLKNIAKLIQISDEDLDQLMHHPQDDALTFAKAETDRIFTFHSLLLMAGIDQEWTSEEILICKNYGLKLGLNQLAVERLLHLQKENKNKAIEAQKVMEIFKTSYN